MTRFSLSQTNLRDQLTDNSARSHGNRFCSVSGSVVQDVTASCRRCADISSMLDILSDESYRVKPSVTHRKTASESLRGNQTMRSRSLNLVLSSIDLCRNVRAKYIYTHHVIPKWLLRTAKIKNKHAWRTVTHSIKKIYVFYSVPPVLFAEQSTSHYMHYPNQPFLISISLLFSFFLLSLQSSVGPSRTL